MENVVANIIVGLAVLLVGAGVTGLFSTWAAVKTLATKLESHEQIDASREEHCQEQLDRLESRLSSLEHYLRRNL